MRQHGVKVLSPRGDFQARPNATDKPEEIGPVDHVFLGLKANAYASAGPLVEPLLGPHTTVIGAQNGIPWWYFYGLPGPYQGRRIESVDPGGAVTKVLPLHRAIGCVVYPATVIESPGVVRHLEGTRFSIGEPDRTMSTRCSEFAAAMIAGGLKCPVEQDLRNDIWIKLMGNIAFNPISALTRATMAGICRHKGAKALVATMMEETLEVARGVGAEPSVSVERRLAGAEKTGEHKTSTLQDLERGRPMELDVLLTAVVELADMVGADVPTLRAISAVADLLNQSVAAAS
jgi:2-dehydropantoate 2-reductase